MLATIAADDPGLLEALAQATLPVADLPDDAARYFALAEGDAVLAYGGIAGIGSDRLLSSVVVLKAARRGGTGSRIVALIEDAVKAAGVERLWLLTADATGFFARLGWHVADRVGAPDAIRQSAQFSSICPASALQWCGS